MSTRFSLFSSPFRTNINKEKCHGLRRKRKVSTSKLESPGWNALALSYGKIAILQVRGFDYHRKPGISLLRVRPLYYYIYLYFHSHKVIADQIFAQLSVNVLREVNTGAGGFYQGQNTRRNGA